MSAAVVVEGFDVPDDSHAGVFLGYGSFAAEGFFLEAGAKRFGHGVVPGQRQVDEHHLEEDTEGRHRRCGDEEAKHAPSHAVRRARWLRRLMTPAGCRFM